MIVGGKGAARLIAGISLLALATPAVTSETVTYRYDTRGRLTRVVHTGTVNHGEDARYTYDKANNRTTVSITGAGGTLLPGFTVDDISLTEGGTLAFTVTKVGSTTNSLSVGFATANASALADTHYTASSGTLTFAAAEASKTVSVLSTNNGIVDGSRVFYLNLLNASIGATIQDAQGVGTVNDDEVAVIPSFAVSDVSATEGGALSFTVTKAGLTGSSYTVSYATANQSANSASDYTASNGTLTFAPTETTKTVTIATGNDTTPENNEQLYLNISGATGGATFADAQGIGTIVNNDGVGLYINDVTTEAGLVVNFAVTKVGPTTSTITVNYQTAPGTAGATDYTHQSGTLSFGPSHTSRVISIQTATNQLFETDETFVVNLSAASSGATIVDDQGVATILMTNSGGCPTCSSTQGGDTDGTPSEPTSEEETLSPGEPDEDTGITAEGGAAVDGDEGNGAATDPDEAAAATEPAAEPTSPNGSGTDTQENADAESAPAEGSAPIP